MRALLIVTLISTVCADEFKKPVKGRVKALPSPKQEDLPKRLKATEGPLFAYQEDRKWGLIDKGGNRVYDPVFSSEPRFSQGFGQLQFAGHALAMTAAGKIVLPPKGATRIGGFSEGLAPVNIGFAIHMGDIIKSRGAWGYMDLAGKLAIPTKFEMTQGFREGLAAAAVKVKNERRVRWGFIDKKGDWAIEPQFLSARTFSDGLAAVGVALPGERFVKQGFINPEGKMVIKPQFMQVKMFADGLVAVKKDQKWGYIDTAGKTVVPFEYDDVGMIKDGIGLVWKWHKDKKGRITDTSCGYVNASGKLVTGMKFKSGYDFSDGMAAIQIGGKWGFVDTTGKMVVPTRYTSPGTFSEGLAAVRVGKKTGFINNSGEVVIKPQFEYAQPFTHGLARVVIETKIKGESVLYKKFGYVNKKGELVFTYT